MNLRDLARKMGLGPLALRLWHQPKNAVDRVAREGALNLAQAKIGQEMMEIAASEIAPIPKDFDEPKLPTEVTFLTGERFWYQTVFCAASLLHFADRKIGVSIVDDGTLKDEHVHQFKRVLPKVRIAMAKDVEARVHEILPSDKFPTLHERRINYPHIRKLTDVHAGRTGWQIVLDSDMLFFRSPGFLVEWLYGPDRPFHLVESATSYGYTPQLMGTLAGCDPPQNLNVGIVGLRSDDIDWERLEHWTRSMIQREGTHYFQEQALSAMLVAGRNCAAAPMADYVVKPTEDEARSPTAVLHHYVAESKNAYFRFGWRTFLDRYQPDLLGDEP